MKAFERYHPFVLFVYFLAVLVTAMFVQNPVLQLLALTGGVLFSVMLLNGRELLSQLIFYIPLFLLIALTNPLFSHNGRTPLFFLNGNPVTLEAVLYGSAIAVMLIAVLLWCKCFSLIMTSDKFLYLFGKVIPKLSLVLTLALRFVPLLQKQMRRVSAAQKSMGLYASQSWFERIRSALRIMSAMITWSLENAVETASTMRARGYGGRRRSQFALFRFQLSDGILLGGIVTLLFGVLWCVVNGAAAFSYYPGLSRLRTDPEAWILYGLYGVLALLPFFIECKERIQWRYYRSKI